MRAFPDSLFTWQCLGQVCAVLALGRLVVKRSWLEERPGGMESDLMKSG